MLKLITFLTLRICVFFFIPKALGRTPTQTSSDVLTYNKFNSHTEYDASAWRGTGTLSFFFNTGKSDAFLLYQDDRSFSYFHFFLVNGTIQATVNFDNCPKSQLIIRGNYSDGRWHRVSLARQIRHLTITVDGCHSKNISCDISSTEREKWEVLYVGSIRIDIPRNSLANPSMADEAIKTTFQGCVGHVTHAVPGGDPEELPLRSTVGTTQGCPSHCSIGEKCNEVTDDVTEKKCETPITPNLAHAHTFTTSFSREQDSLRLYSTPMFVNSTQPRILSTEMALSDTTVGSTGTHSVSTHVPEHAQIGNKTSLILGRSSSLKKYSAVLSTPTSTVDNEVAAIAKENSAFCPRGHYIIFYLGLLVLLKTVVKDN
ncbi:uncharacterized protein [Montipora foliosa]|uniref:uncharacterized protein n=1 Tax=Montipora foliosa TaxID=591990 RepID=UPI0035F154AD